MFTLSDTLARIGAALAGPPGVAAIVALIALLLAREVVANLPGERPRRWRQRLNVGAAPLLTSFAVIALLRLTPDAGIGAVLRGPGVALEPAVPTAVVGAVPPVPTPTTVVATPTAVAAAPSPTPGPTPSVAVPPAPDLIAQRAASARAGLRSGQLEVTLDYGNGVRSLSTVRFDLGGAGAAPRLYVRTTYQGNTGSRSGESVTVGGESWARNADGPWVKQDRAEDVSARVAAFLAPAPPATAAVTPDGGLLATLRWYDGARDADLALQVDPVSGVPAQLRQTVRTGSPTLVVRYIVWNGPVDIAPPTP